MLGGNLLSIWCLTENLLQQGRRGLVQLIEGPLFRPVVFGDAFLDLDSYKLTLVFQHTVCNATLSLICFFYYLFLNCTVWTTTFPHLPVTISLFDIAPLNTCSPPKLLLIAGKKKSFLFFALWHIKPKIQTYWETVLVFSCQETHSGIPQKSASTSQVQAHGVPSEAEGTEHIVVIPANYFAKKSGRRGNTEGPGKDVINHKQALVVPTWKNRAKETAPLFPLFPARSEV